MRLSLRETGVLMKLTRATSPYLGKQLLLKPLGACLLHRIPNS